MIDEGPRRDHGHGAASMGNSQKQGQSQMEPCSKQTALCTANRARPAQQAATQQAALSDSSGSRGMGLDRDLRTVRVVRWPWPDSALGRRPTGTSHRENNSVRQREGKCRAETTKRDLQFRVWIDPIRQELGTSEVLWFWL